MTLGERIRQYRSEKGMSQGDLADALEVSRQSVSKWENDQAVPELDKLMKTAEIFSLTLDELVRGKEPERTGEIPVSETGGSRAAVPVKGAVSGGQRITGVILLCTAAVILLFLTLLGGFLSGLIFCSPFAACGLICLFCRRHAGLWCAWAVYACVDNYMHYATGVSRLRIFTPFLYAEGSNPVVVLLCWVMFLVFAVLLVITLVRFRKLRLPVTRKNVLLVCGLFGGIVMVYLLGVGGSLILNHQITAYGYIERQWLIRFLSWILFLFDEVRACLFGAGLVVGLGLLRGRKNG